MPDLADLFPGFATRNLSGEAGRIVARVGGSGPPLALLHGFPETAAMWHHLAPELAKGVTVVAIDLRGYGWSATPDSHGGEGYTKRVMAADIVRIMEELGYVRFALAGHDRGARVGYRLALDHPGRLSALALLDVIPTAEQWRKIEKDPTSNPHWRDLAEPEPKPEKAIGANPEAYLEALMAKWSGTGSLAAFDPRALDHYRAAWGDPSHIHAMCEDYRAGATLDRAHDEADLASGRAIACPVHILASSGHLDAGDGEKALDTWRRTFAPSATGTEIPGGHFMAEEAPQETLDALLGFLNANAR